MHSLNPHKHIIALVNKLANVKVGLVAANKQAAENVRISIALSNKISLTYAVKLRNTCVFRRKCISNP